MGLFELPAPVLHRFLDLRFVCIPEERKHIQPGAAGTVVFQLGNAAVFAAGHKPEPVTYQQHHKVALLNAGSRELFWCARVGRPVLHRVDYKSGATQRVDDSAAVLCKILECR